MIQEKMIGKCHLFCLYGVLHTKSPQQKYRLKLISKQEHQQARWKYEREYYEGDKPVRIIKIMAETGMLDGFFSNNVIKNAKKFGKLPEGYQIHHIIPLKLGGSNELSNLCIVDAETHIQMHRLIYQQIMDRMHENETAFLLLPPFKSVIFKEDREVFFLRSEIRKMDRENTPEVVGKHKKSWLNLNSNMGRRDAFVRSSWSRA